MAVIKRTGSMNVVEAAERRVKNIFSNGLRVYFSFSGGKDSLALAAVIMNLVQRGEIDPKQMTVQFIDEEAIYPDIEATVLRWRKKFLLIGAQFEWFCVEVRHFNCFNQLENDESFICWDSTKQDRWVRTPPPFAIREHPLLRKRIDNYQSFLPKVCADGISMIGIRTAESIQRLKNLAMMFTSKNTFAQDRKIFPIYDWTNRDVWRYLLENNVEIPKVYLYLWQSGTDKSRLRISQFFSIDTAKCLVSMNEYYPDLMERVIKREPNAYLASLYWDSEMFGRRTRARKKNEEQEHDNRDYRQMILDKLKEIYASNPSQHKLKIANHYRRFLIKVDTIADDEDYKSIYEGLLSGDPKMRTLRALYTRVNTKYINQEKRVRANG